MAGWYRNADDTSFNLPSDAEAKARRQQELEQYMVENGYPLPDGAAQPPARVRLDGDGYGHLPTMDFRRGGDPMGDVGMKPGPYLDPYQLGLLKPTDPKMLGGEPSSFAAPVIGDAVSGAFPSYQPSQPATPSTLGGASGMGTQPWGAWGGLGMGQAGTSAMQSSSGYGRQSATPYGGGSATPYGMGRSSAAGGGGNATPYGAARQSATPYGGGYNTLGAIASGSYGRRG
jgi:hypothetical protein